MGAKFMLLKVISKTDHDLILFKSDSFYVINKSSPIVTWANALMGFFRLFLVKCPVCLQRPGAKLTGPRTGPRGF